MSVYKDLANDVSVCKFGSNSTTPECLSHPSDHRIKAREEGSSEKVMLVSTHAPKMRFKKVKKWWEKAV